MIGLLAWQLPALQPPQGPLRLSSQPACFSSPPSPADNPTLYRHLVERLASVLDLRAQSDAQARAAAPAPAAVPVPLPSSAWHAAALLTPLAALPMPRCSCAGAGERAGAQQHGVDDGAGLRAAQTQRDGALLLRCAVHVVPALRMPGGSGQAAERPPSPDPSQTTWLPHCRRSSAASSSWWATSGSTAS